MLQQEQQRATKMEQESICDSTKQHGKHPSRLPLELSYAMNDGNVTTSVVVTANTQIRCGKITMWTVITEDQIWKNNPVCPLAEHSDALWPVGQSADS